MTEIINLLLSTGIVPDSYKLAMVNQACFKSKVLEKIILCQLFKHFTDLSVNNLEIVFQSMIYEIYHCTESGLVKVT